MRSCQPLASSPAALVEVPAREPHLSANLARLVLELLHERARDSNAVSAGAQLVPVSDANARIPASSLSTLLEVSRRLLEDENVGLHAGQRADAGRLGLFGLLQQTAASPRALAPVVRRFSRLLHDESVFDLRERGGEALFTFRCEDSQRQSVELVVTALVSCARQIWPSCPLQAVFFSHAAPSCSDEHTSFFCAPVHFDAPYNGYAIGSEHLDAPAIGADPGLHAALTEHAERVLDSIDFVAAVRQAVGRGLMLGHAGAPWVASELGISSRTLHRRLQEKAAHFSAIVDDERSRRARTQLSAHARVAEVARKLGFASPGAFRKAFKRWTGLTPAEFKRRAALSAALAS
jgi:AraC-like DNA-binding protein